MTDAPTPPLGTPGGAPGDDPTSVMPTLPPTQPPPTAPLPGYPSQPPTGYPTQPPGGYPPAPAGSGPGGPPRRNGVLIGAVAVVVAVLLLTAGALFLLVGDDDDGDDDAGPTTTEQDGDGTTASTDPDGTTEPDGSTEPSAGEAVDRVVGSWSGTYDCAQGLTNLDLTIEAGGGDDEVTAVFSFSAHPSNPDVPSGSFEMSGTATDDGGLVLEPGEWIDRPGSFSTVGLSAPLPAVPNQLTGTVEDAPGCTRFQVTRG